MTSFDTDKKNLTFLLDQIENGDLALPDFQRDFVWEPGATRELIRSVMQSFPAGNLLLLHSGAEYFAPRPFTEAPSLTSAPSYMVLDGQQRLTSLSLAFAGRGSHRYFLNLKELLEGEDLDEAVEVYPLSRIGALASVEGQANSLTLPLSKLRAFADWRDEVLDKRDDLGLGDDSKALRKQLNDLEKLYIKPVEQYQFPVTTLGSGTALEAVCTIFETLNRTGVKLSVFDLLTARGFAQNVRLRDMWDQAQADHAIIGEFGIDPYYLLQVVAIWAKGDPRRGTVLSLDVAKDIEPRWADAARSLAGSLKMLQSECGVLTPRLLPYATMLLTLAATWPEIESSTGPAVASARAKLTRWFWCATFTQRYENQPNSRSQVDVPTLRAWIRGGDAPEVLQATFEPAQWKTITYRQQALYRASLALSLRHHPHDFHAGKPLTAERIAEEQVDDHHIFPQAYLKAAESSPYVDSVLNRTLIDKKTNIRISDKAPSVYLGEMRDELSAELLHTILCSHGLPDDADSPLFRDDFERFLEWRQNRLSLELTKVTGWSL